MTWVLENRGTANLAFSLLPMLTVGAIEAIEKHGSMAQKALYLSMLISGEWPEKMNRTEPQAGSDVGALKTVATLLAWKVPDQGHQDLHRLGGKISRYGKYLCLLEKLQYAPQTKDG